MSCDCKSLFLGIVCGRILFPKSVRFASNKAHHHLVRLMITEKPKPKTKDMMKLLMKTPAVLVLITMVLLGHGCEIDPEYPGSVRDIDGNRYGTTVIGTQTWMTSNLRVTRYNDGTAIPLVEDSMVWRGIAHPAYCWYNNDSLAMLQGGALYNFYVFDNAFNGGKQVCPVGWHVATLDEWEVLIEFVGGYKEAGFELKHHKYTEWSQMVDGPQNKYGFSALPEGYRTGLGGFDHGSDWSSWWTSTQSSATAGNGLVTGEMTYAISLNDKLTKRVGKSIRCIKDSSN